MRAACPRWACTNDPNVAKCTDDPTRSAARSTPASTTVSLPEDLRRVAHVEVRRDADDLGDRLQQLAGGAAGARPGRRRTRDRSTHERDEHARRARRRAVAHLAKVHGAQRAGSGRVERRERPALWPRRPRTRSRSAAATVASSGRKHAAPRDVDDVVAAALREEADRPAGRDDELRARAVAHDRVGRGDRSGVRRARATGSARALSTTRVALPRELLVVRELEEGAAAAAVGVLAGDALQSSERPAPTLARARRAQNRARAARKLPQSAGGWTHRTSRGRSWAPGARARLRIGGIERGRGRAGCSRPRTRSTPSSRARTRLPTPTCPASTASCGIAGMSGSMRHGPRPSCANGVTGPSTNRARSRTIRFERPLLTSSVGRQAAHQRPGRFPVARDERPAAPSLERRRTARATRHGRCLEHRAVRVRPPGRGASRPRGAGATRELVPVDREPDGPSAPARRRPGAQRQRDASPERPPAARAGPTKAGSGREAQPSTWPPPRALEPSLGVGSNGHASWARIGKSSPSGHCRTAGPKMG